MKLSAKNLHSITGCPGRRKLFSVLTGLLFLTLGLSLESAAVPRAGGGLKMVFAGTPDVTNPLTTFTVTVNNAVADGSATDQITAHIADASGNPVAGVTVYITVSGVTFQVTTNSSGDAPLMFSKTVAGNVAVTASVVTSAGPPVVLAALNGGASQLANFIPGPVSYTASGTYIAATTTGSVANGVAQDGVKVHVTDATGNVIQGASIVFSIVSGTGTFVGTTTLTTDATGTATIPLTSTVAGQVNITATINGTSVINGNPATVTFVAGPPDLTVATTKLTVTTTGSVADGIATDAVNAHITDSYGNPITGQAIVFSIFSGTGTFVGSTTVTTDASGNAPISLTSTVAGPVNVSATLNGNNLTGSPAQVVFVAGAPDVTNPSTTLTELTTGATADGAATNSVKAHIVDKYGNPVSNQAVTFSIFSGTGVFVGSATVTTDVNGNAVIALTSTVAGTVGITAKVGGQPIAGGAPANVIFVAGTPSTSNPLTTLTQNTTGATADGSATNSVKAHIVDANGNPVANQSVTFAIASGTGNFVGGIATATTDASGNAIIYLSSTVAGTVGLTATVSGQPINNGVPAPNVIFVAGAPSTTSPTTVITENTTGATANGTATNSVKAHITDANGNPVANQSVTFAITSGAGTFVGSTTVTTDVNGDAIISLTSTVAGTVVVSATVGGQPINNGTPPPSLVFVAGSPSTTSPGTTLNPGITNSPADGTTTNSVVAQITDANGNPVPNQTVTFAIASGTGSFVGGIATVTTNSLGIATIYLTSTVAGTVNVTATVGGNAITNGTVPSPVVFVAGAPSTTSPTTVITENTTGAVADGVATNSVKAHITDANGNPVANQTVTFTIASGTANFAGGTFTATTDANGDAIISLTSTVAGTVVVSATVGGQPINSGVPPPSVVFVAGAPSTTSPTTVITENTTGAVADGVATNSVKAHITDANGNPVANQAVIFAIVSGTGTFVGTTTVTTDANGDAIISLTSTVAGTVVVSAKVGGQPIVSGTPAPSVVFVAGAPSTTSPTTVITENTTGAVADGTSTNSVKAHITDANGNPVANQSVTFAITSGTGAFVGTTTITTDANGDAIISLTSTVAGTVVVSATVGGQPINNGVPPPSVVFVASTPSVSSPTTVITENTTGAVADGAATNSVKAHITDANGNPVANQSVTFAITSGTGSFVGSTTVTTDANGDAIISLTSTVAGTVVVSATIGGQPINNGVPPPSVVFVAGTPSTTSPGTTLNPGITNSPADGTTTNSVVAQITDANGNPVPNQTVTFAIASGTGSFVGGTATATTNSLGIATIYLTSTVAGTVNVTATVGGNAITNGTVPSPVVFVAVPDVTNPGTKIEPGATNAIADGVATNSVVATVVDANGVPIANQTVTFAIASGTGGFVGGVATATTNSLGVATIYLTSTVAGTVTVTATIGGKSITNGTNPAPVVFVAGPPDVTNSNTTIAVVTNDAEADGIAADSVKVHLVDKNGNPVAGQAVIFSISSGTANFVGPTTVTTDANGNFTIALTSTVVGTADVQATVNGNTITNGSPAQAIFTSQPDPTNQQTRIFVVVNNAFADGTSPNSVEVHVVDQNGDPLPGRDVVFSIDSGNAVITTTQPVQTDANGDAIIQLTSKTTGDVLLSAKVENISIVFGSPARVHFVGVNIYVPNVFTPNNDGVNDVLKPILVGMSAFHYFSVYNRWGNLLFTTQDANTGWDGTIHGTPQPVETYLWIAEGIDNNGNKIVRKGMVSLVR